MVRDEYKRTEGIKRNSNVRPSGCLLRFAGRDGVR